ncbi:MAG: hypothetical protein H9535_05555 [Ignavibacteria bacterium]|nr:hypothetical protein [Ignavibacteria bacterium]
MLVCLDAECLRGDNDGCTTLVSTLLQQGSSFHQSDNHASYGNNDGTTVIAQPDSSSNHEHHEGDAHHCSCVCHVPAFVQALSFPTAIFIEHSYPVANPLAAHSLRSGSLYRPPIA